MTWRVLRFREFPDVDTAHFFLDVDIQRRIPAFYRHHLRLIGDVRACNHRQAKSARAVSSIRCSKSMASPTVPVWSLANSAVQIRFPCCVTCEDSFS